MHFAKILDTLIETLIFVLNMKKYFALSLLAIILYSCSGDKKPAAKPYKLDRNNYVKLVKANKMMYDSVRYDGKLVETFYYLPDTGKIRLYYDSKGTLVSSEKYNEHGQRVLQEFFYESGQRSQMYPIATFDDFNPNGSRHGYCEEYYEDGKLKSVSEYKKGQMLWQLEYTKEGASMDTTLYEYVEPKIEPEKPEPAPKVKIEKIKTATTPN